MRCGDGHVVDEEVAARIVDEVMLVTLMVGVAARVIVTFAR